jgi:hypothetical protein
MTASSVEHHRSLGTTAIYLRKIGQLNHLLANSSDPDTDPGTDRRCHNALCANRFGISLTQIQPEPSRSAAQHGPPP